MAPKEGSNLKNRYLPLLLTTLILFLYNFTHAQTFNPSLHVVINSAMGEAQAAPLEGRSMYYDATNFRYRAFQSTAEVKSYLNLAKYRFGNFIIVIDSAGLLQPGGFYIGGVNTFWMFKDSTADANLVELNLLGSSGTCAGCLLKTNNLSDVTSITGARTNLLINNVDNTSDVTKWAASATLTNKSISGTTNTFSNIPNSALSNNSIGLTLTATGTDIGIPVTPAALGTSLTINIPTSSVSVRGALASGDFVRFNAKVDSTSMNSGDSVFDWHNGSQVFRYVAPAGITRGNADSIKSLPVDTSVRRNNYVLSFDSVNHKWFLASPPGSAGIGSLNGLTVSTQTFATGLTGTDFGISSSGSVHTFNLPIASATNTGKLSSADWVIFNAKQPQLNGTGFVKASGTTISYDNTVYYPNSNPSNFIALTALSATSPVFYNNSTGVISEQVANTSQNGYLTSTDWNTFNNKGSGSITSITVTVPSSLLTIGGSPITTSGTFAFGLATQTAYTGFGNWTASTATPTFGKIPYQAFASGTPNYLFGLDGSGNPTLLKPDTLFYRELGQPGDSVGWISSTGIVNFRLIRDSLNFHHVTNSDSSWTFYSTGGTSSLTNTHIFVGNGSNVATDVAMSGDATMANTGALTVANNAITYAKIQTASGQGLMGATGAGNFGLITLGTNLSMSGSVLNAAAGSSQTLPQVLTTGRTLGGNDSILLTGNQLAITGGLTRVDSLRIYKMVTPFARIGTVNFFGDSYRNPATGATVFDSSEVAMFVDTFKVQYNNFSLSGSGVRYAIQVMDSLVQGPFNVCIDNWMAGYNDARAAGNNATTPLKVASAIHAGWLDHFATKYVAGGDTSTAFINTFGTWTKNLNATTGAGKTKNAASTSTINDSTTYDFIGTAFGVQLIGGDNSTYITSSVGLYVDGTLQGTYNTTVADGTTVSGIVNNRIPYAITVAGLTFGKHHIKLINTEAKIMYVDYWTVLSAARQPFIMYHCAYPVASAGTQYLAVNNAIDSMFAVLPNTYPGWVVPVNDVFDRTTGLSGDGIHPNNTGYKQILRSSLNKWNSFAQSFQGMLVGDSSSLFYYNKGYNRIPTIKEVWGRSEGAYNFTGYVGIPANSSFKVGGIDIWKADVTNKNYLIGNAVGILFTPGSATNNIGMGDLSLTGCTTCAADVAIGSGTMQLATTAQDNTAIGAFTMQQNTTGSSNTAIGKNALKATATGSNNVGIGWGTLVANTASSNTAVGTSAGGANTSGTGLCLLGYQAGQAFSTGNYNAGVGYQIFSSGTGSQNSGIGGFSQAFQTSGTGNSSVGYQSLYGNGGNASWNYSSAIGFTAGKTNQADSNLFLGSFTGINALATSITGKGNIIIGKANDTLLTSATNDFLNIASIITGLTTTKQISINNFASPTATAQFEVGGTTRGVLIPRLTTTQQNAITSPATGLIIYNTDTAGLVDYNGTAWLKERGTGSTNIYNTDGTLTANRTLSGANFTLALGTSGSKLSGLSAWSTTGVSLTGGQYNSQTGSQLLEVASTINNPVTAASGNVTGFAAYAFFAPTITSTNASVTYASPSTVYIDNSPTMSTNSTATGAVYALNVAAGGVHFGVGTSNASLKADGGMAIDGASYTNTVGLSLGASTSSKATLNIPTGTDPSTGGVNTGSGNMWYNGTNLYFVDGSVTGVARDVLNGLHNYRHGIFTPTTGGTVNTVVNQYNIINPAGALVALTVNLPSSPNNNDVVYIKFTQTVSTVTYGNGTVVDGITAPVAGGLVVLTFDSGSASWY
jgi:hypothetical protein